MTVARVRLPAPCAICGGSYRPTTITRADRDRWRDLAKWVTTACDPCRRRLDSSAAKSHRRNADT